MIKFKLKNLPNFDNALESMSLRSNEVESIISEMSSVIGMLHSLKCCLNLCFVANPATLTGDLQISVY